MTTPSQSSATSTNTDPLRDLVALSRNLRDSEAHYDTGTEV